LLRDLNSGIVEARIHLADCSVTWRGFERRWNTDPLRHRERLRFKVAAHQSHPPEEDDADDQEVGQNWHSHRDVSRPNAIGIWLGEASQSVLQITFAANDSHLSPFAPPYLLGRPGWRLLGDDWLARMNEAAGAFNGLPRELRQNMQPI
jgi:hypothetical protein